VNVSQIHQIIQSVKRLERKPANIGEMCTETGQRRAIWPVSTKNELKVLIVSKLFGDGRKDVKALLSAHGS
jgi:hypothetical protein